MREALVERNKSSECRMQVVREEKGDNRGKALVASLSTLCVTPMFMEGTALTSERYMNRIMAIPRLKRTSEGGDRGPRRRP